MQQNSKARNKPHTLSQLIFNMGAKTMQQGKNSFLQQIVLGHLDIHMQRMNLDPSLTPHKVI